MYWTTKSISTNVVTTLLYVIWFASDPNRVKPVLFSDGLDWNRLVTYPIRFKLLSLGFNPLPSVGKTTLPKRWFYLNWFVLAFSSYLWTGLRYIVKSLHVTFFVFVLYIYSCFQLSGMHLCCRTAHSFFHWVHLTLHTKTYEIISHSTFRPHHKLIYFGLTLKKISRLFFTQSCSLFLLSIYCRCL